MMGVFVNAGGDFERLVAKLAEVVDDGRRASDDGLVAQWSRPAKIVVPTLEMGEFVRQTVSRLGGVAVNYEITTLVKFLTTQINEAAAETPKILDREVMKTLLIEIFDGDNDIPSAIASYLDGGAEVALDRRRYQLARKVATVFEEYIFSRPELLNSWEAGEFQFEDAAPRVAEIERWQARLWCRLIEGCDHLPIPRAFDKVVAKVAHGLSETTGGPLHLFGFAGFGKQYLKMLQKLGDRHLDVYFYFVTPTARDAKSIDDATDDLHPALAAWGKVWRDTLIELSEMVDGDIRQIQPETVNAETSSAAVLTTLQGFIDAGVDTEFDPVSLDADPTKSGLAFLQCPGIRREVEVVANEIWKLLGADPNLRFSDIAVVLPQGQSESYLAQVESVFNEFEELPFKNNGLNLRGRSAVLDAVELLLGLPFSEFHRQELLALLVHPNFASRYRDIDDATWIDWADRLNILYGADREHQTRRGSYLTTDLFNWDQGMKRLALGAFLQVDDAPEQAEVSVGDFKYFPENISLTEMTTASALNASVTSLVDDMRWIRHENVHQREDRTLQQWANIMAALVETYLVASTDEDGDFEDDAQVLHRIKETLCELVELPDIGTISYETAYLYALDRLATLKAPGGQRLTEGVIVSTAQRLRALPFKHVFVLGAGEGIFPAKDPRSELDLRLQEPKRGDILPSERDRFHFLEILQAAQDSLTISWVGREASTGESLPPSSIVSDLRRMIPVERDAPDGELSDLDRLTESHPLRRYSKDYDFRELSGESGNLGRNYHPEAFEEARMRALRELFLEYSHQLRGQTIWTGRAFREVQRRIFDARADQKRWPDWRARRYGLRLIEPGDENGERSLPDELSLSKLSSFLKSPLQAKAKTAVRVYDDEDDVLAGERESFEFERLVEYGLVRDAFGRMAQQPERLAEIDTALDAVHEAMETQYRNGDLPVEMFAEVAVRNLAAKLAKIGLNLRDVFSKHLDIDVTETAQPLEFRKDACEGQLEAPTLPVAGEEKQIWLAGRTPLFYARSETFLSIKTTTSDSSNPTASDFINGYLAHLALSSLGRPYENTMRQAVVVTARNCKLTSPGPGTAKKNFCLGLPPISASEAKRNLESLVSELLLDESAELLPIEVVEALAKKGGDRSAAWRMAIGIQEAAGPRGGGIRTQYGPIRDYLTYPPPDNPAQVIAERFKFHSKLVPEGKEEGQ